MTKYAGADWLRSTGQTAELGPFAESVANLIGDLTRGIYHVADEVKRIDWSHEDCIEWRTRWPLATFDGPALTELVVLAHDRCIRIEINPMSPSTLAIVFHPRPVRTGRLFARHPELEDHAAQIRTRLRR